MTICTLAVQKAGGGGRPKNAQLRHRARVPGVDNSICHFQSSQLFAQRLEGMVKETSTERLNTSLSKAGWVRSLPSCTKTATFASFWLTNEGRHTALARVASDLLKRALESLLRKGSFTFWFAISLACYKLLAVPSSKRLSSNFLWFGLYQIPPVSRSELAFEPDRRFFGILFLV